MAKRRSGNYLLRLSITLMVIGFGSVGLSFTDYQFTLLSWANPLQPWIGLVIGVAGIAMIAIPLLRARGGGGSMGPAQSFQQQGNFGYAAPQQQFPPQQPGFNQPGMNQQPGFNPQQAQAGFAPQQGFNNPQQGFNNPQQGFNPQHQNFGPPQHAGPQQHSGPQPIPGAQPNPRPAQNFGQQPNYGPPQNFGPQS